MYADMRHDAKKRRDAQQDATGAAWHDKIGQMNIEEVMSEMKGGEMHKDDRVNFNKLLESCAIIQMGMGSMDYYERVVMEEKQRTLKIEVAASLIGSTIRGYLARQKRQREMQAAARRAQFLKETDQEIGILSPEEKAAEKERRRQERAERKERKERKAWSQALEGTKKRRRKKKKGDAGSEEGEPLLLPNDEPAAVTLPSQQSPP